MSIQTLRRVLPALRIGHSQLYSSRFATTVKTESTVPKKPKVPRDAERDVEKEARAILICIDSRFFSPKCTRLPLQNVRIVGFHSDETTSVRGHAAAPCGRA